MFRNYFRKLVYFFKIRKNNIDDYDLLLPSDLVESPIAKNSIATEVHFLWVGSKLSELEYLSASSFIKSGFSVNFWCYNKIDNVPNGLFIRDANDIISESEVKKCKNGSYAAFSDLFRYKVLSQKFGMWSDLDVICLVSEIEFRTKIDKPFFVSEFVDDVNNVQINNNLIYVPKHHRSEILKVAADLCERIDIYGQQWGAGGPRLVTNLLRIFDAGYYMVMAPEFANPIPSFKCPGGLLKEGQTSDNVWFLHCYNETWRRKNVSKNKKFPQNSIIDNATKKFIGES